MSESIVETYIKQAAEAYFARRRQLLASIRTREEAAARQQEVRRVCGEIFGPFHERTPLKVKTVSRLEREGYEVEALTYESLPGVPVTANLYLPRGKQAVKPYPAVVCPIGHWVDGKVQNDHQRLGQLMACRGIAALIFDGVGQGERVQYFDVTLRRSWVGKTVTDEHTMLGNALFLTGHHLGNFMMWDAMRGLDMLCERGDIDPKRLGSTGASGGGTLTRYLCGMEPRLAAAVCVADNLQSDSMGGADAEQNLFGSWPKGVSPFDLLHVFAPRPLLLAYCSGDNAGERIVANLAEMRSWYQHFGATEKVDAFMGDGPHGYLKDIRARAVEFFAKAFGLPDQPAREPQTPVEPAHLLYATETGQVRNSLNAVDLFTYHREKVKNLPPPMPAPRDAAGASAFQEEIRAKIRAHLKLPEPTKPVTGEVEGHSSDWGLAAERGRLVVEEGLYLPYSYYTERESEEGRAAKPAILALHERGLAALSAQGPWMTRLASAGMNILAIDVRGTGETKFTPSRDDGDPYDALLLGSEASWARKALNVGLTLFGGRVFDALRALSYLRTRWDVQPERIRLVGVGSRGALWALYAAALDPRVESVVLIRGLATYKCLVERRRYNHHFSLFLPGVLKDYDLPHVACCVAPRPLTLLNGVDQRRERLRAEDVARAYTFPTEVYKKLNAPKAFKVLSTDSAPETLEALAAALGAGPNE